MLNITRYNASSILTATCGFLVDKTAQACEPCGYTHTLNPAIGCPYGVGFCGLYCYAAQSQAHFCYGNGQSWGSYVKVKQNAPLLLDKEFRRAARRDPDHPLHVTKLKIFASSSTDPRAGPVLAVFRECLRVAAEYPIAKFVVQTRSPQVRQLRQEIEALGSRGAVSYTIETDSDAILEQGPKGAPDIRIRRKVAEELKAWKTTMQLAISPCLRLVDPRGFADWIAATAEYATVDTFVSGDGSPNGNGARTARSGLPILYEECGWDWRDESQAQELLALLRDRMGDRVGWSSQGFMRLADL